MEYVASLFLRIWSTEYQWDYLHCVPEGVARSLFHKWVSNESQIIKFITLKGHWQKLTHLLQQRPPHYFTRSPRSLTKHLAYWKASEIHTWLLHYALPVMPDFLLPCISITLLCWRQHILLNQDISETQITAAGTIYYWYILHLTSWTLWWAELYYHFTLPHSHYKVHTTVGTTVDPFCIHIWQYEWPSISLL